MSTLTARICDNLSAGYQEFFIPKRYRCALGIVLDVLGTFAISIAALVQLVVDRAILTKSSLCRLTFEDAISSQQRWISDKGANTASKCKAPSSITYANKNTRNGHLM